MSAYIQGHSPSPDILYPFLIVYFIGRFNSYNLKAQDDNLVETYPVGLRRRRLWLMVALVAVLGIIVIVSFAVRLGDVAHVGETLVSQCSVSLRGSWERRWDSKENISS